MSGEKQHDTNPRSAGLTGKLISLAVVMAFAAACGHSGGTSAQQSQTPAPPTVSAPPTASSPVSPRPSTAPPTVEPTTAPSPTRGRLTDLADGRHAVRIKAVDAAHRKITIDVIQFFIGKAAARAAAEDHAPEVPPPNDIWIRNTSSRLRVLSVGPGAPITVNVFGAPESGSATKNVPKTLAQLAAIHELKDGVFWVSLTHGRVTRIAQQYIP